MVTFIFPASVVGINLAVSILVLLIPDFSGNPDFSLISVCSSGNPNFSWQSQYFPGNPGLSLDVDVVSLSVFRRDLKFLDVLSASHILFPAIISFLWSPSC